MQLSAAILTKNEEDNIKRCIKAVSFCDEIIVIDDNSSDDTKKVAENLGAKVYQRYLGNNFSKQRNYALSKTKGKWILFVDADEVVSEGLKTEIIQVVNNPLATFSGYYLKRQDVIWDKKLKYGESGNSKILRLAKVDVGKFRRGVHEYWNIVGKTKTLNNTLFHYPHINLRSFIKNINHFSSLHARANLKEGKRSNLVKVIVWPPGKFFYNYFLKLGIFDGVIGFVVALMMSFHSYLSWSKLWIMQKEI